MAHTHNIRDSDKHFVIDTATKEIKNCSGKFALMQDDHNSERITFEIPREVEGHDMLLCNMVQVQFVNIDSETRTKNAGVYIVEDFQISPDNENVLVGSWLVSNQATKYKGSLNFLLRFLCVAADGSIEYVWSSAIFKGISVSQSYNNTDVVVEECADIFAQLQARIEALEQGGGSGHMHANKDVLDKFGWNYTKTQPTFGGSTQSHALATLDDVTTRVNYLQQNLEKQISMLPKFAVEVVEELPTTDISYSTLYLVKITEAGGNLYTEYIYVKGMWEKLGTQSFDVDIPSKEEIVADVLDALQAAEGGLY